MAGLTDRFRGQVVIGGVLSNQIAQLSSSPLAAPTIAVVTLSTAAAAPQFIFTVTMNREAFGDTDGAPLARRASMSYHFEDTAGALLDGAVFTAASAVASSGLTAAGLVIPSSTETRGFMTGRIICSSTGQCTAGFTGTSGGGTTGVFVITLPNGLVATSSQVAFST
jgi:hypothetical protein